MDQEKEECEFCHTKTWNVRQHLDRSKKCKKLREGMDIRTKEQIITDLYDEINEKDELLEEKEEEIEELKRTISKLARQIVKKDEIIKNQDQEFKDLNFDPDIRINSKLINNKTKKRILSHSPDLSIENIKRVCDLIGPDLLKIKFSIPDLFISKIVRNKEGKYGAITTDFSRKKVIFKKPNEEKSIIDINGEKLTNNFITISKPLIESSLKLLKKNKDYKIIKDRVRSDIIISDIVNRLYRVSDNDPIINPLQPDQISQNQIKSEDKEKFEKEMEKVKVKSIKFNFKDPMNGFYHDNDLEEQYKEDELHTMSGYCDKAKKEIDVETTYIDIIKLYIKQKEDKLKIKYNII